MHLIRTLIAALVAGIPAGSTAGCAVQSGPGTAALVELYTSEGCSSCPPADRQLGELRSGETVVPLALHVGYWDDLGWSDPFAQDAFARRQHWLIQFGGIRTLYTPQFFVAGTVARPETLNERIGELNAESSRASLLLEAHALGEGTLWVSASARSRVEAAALYLAVAENGLSSRVLAGENGGRRLSHDHVVRAWIGPLRLHDGRLDLQRSIPLEKNWRRAQLEVIGFVQDQHTGRVLQAVGASGCAGS